jgi:peroxiredoxin
MKKNVIAIIFGFITIWNFGQGKDSFIVDKGDQAFDFVGMDEKGNEIKLSDFKGEKFVLLNFTATACGPCWGTYDQMNRIQDKYSERLKVISFHEDNFREQWNEIAEKNGIEFNCTSIWTAENKKEISKVYQIDGWPYFFLIDKKGFIVEKWFGNNEKKLKKRIKKYLK